MTEITCPKCNKIFTRKNTMVNHLKKCDGLKSTQCERCHKDFSDRTTKYRHKKSNVCERNGTNKLTEIPQQVIVEHTTHNDELPIILSKTFPLHKIKKCILKCGRHVYRDYNHCSDCLRFLDPYNPVWNSFKQKETYICNDLRNDFNNRNIIYDKQISCQGCHRRRPDVFIDLYNYCVMIEIDEHQHKNYLCEEKRMMEIFESLGSRPLVVLRFNPDACDNEPSVFNFGVSGIIKPTDKYIQRYNVLKKRFQYYLENEPAKEITVEYLYFDKSINIQV
jgi:hypothetical protein